MLFCMKIVVVVVVVVVLVVFQCSVLVPSLNNFVVLLKMTLFACVAEKLTAFVVEKPTVSVFVFVKPSVLLKHQVDFCHHSLVSSAVRSVPVYVLMVVEMTLFVLQNVFEQLQIRILVFLLMPSVFVDVKAIFCRLPNVSSRQISGFVSEIFVVKWSVDCWEKWNVVFVFL